MINIVKKTIKKGLLHIFSANILNKFIGFFTSIILVRILSKSTFGLWSYSLTIIKFFMIFAGFGAANATLQFCSTESTKEGKSSYLFYGLKFGILTSFLLACFIVLSTWIVDYSINDSESVIRSLCLLPLLVFLYRNLTNYLRSNFQNIQYSILNSFNTVLTLILVTIGAYYFNVKGLIISRYLTFIIVLIAGFFFLKRLYTNKNVIELDKTQKKEFISFSVVSTLTNSVSQILYLIDIFLIGMIMNSNTIIASYKTATIIPFNMNFISISIMVFAYPYFASKYDQKQIVKHYFYKLQIGLLAISTLIGTLLYIFAPFVISFLFGTKYADSVTPFRILLFGFVIASTFRIPAGNLLLSLKKVNINLNIAILSGIVNIGMNYFMIKKFGAIGAAISTVFVIIISSLLSNLYLLRYLRK